MSLKILRDRHGARVITPHQGGLPEEAPEVDAAVLDVAGGHLTWSVLSDEPPVAVIDDTDTAQSWIWALYGEAVALALAEDAPAEVVEHDPALPGLLSSAARLAYAHWAARWWPASTIDAIPPLDETLLANEIAELTGECELLFAAEEAEVSHTPVPVPASPDAYALAAGPATGADAGLPLARGTTGTDWRRCPPGLIDASEQAVSWQVSRLAARTVVAVSAVPAPGLPGSVPTHLWPHAAVSGAAGDITLHLRDDSWIGDSTLLAAIGPEITVDVYLPGIAAPAAEADIALRERVRDLARTRLAHIREGTAEAPLRAEIAAAGAETDY